MRYIKLILCLFLAITSVVAQEYDLKSYSEGDGLSSAVVYSITQDELGYLWLGTSYGLNKFDGQKFKQFYTNDGLLDNRVSKVNIDNEALHQGKEDEAR